MADVFGYAKSEPAVFAASQGSWEVWLTDRAWLLRTDSDGGVDEEGSPVEDDDTLGPYKAKLSIPNPNEQRQPDRWQRTIAYRLNLVCDERPRERDKVRVREEGGEADHVYRVLEVRRSKSAFGETVAWSLELQRTEEY